MPTSESLAVIASLANILAFVLYNRQLLKGKTKPSIISWLIWAIIVTLNFTSYRVMSADWLKTILPTVSSVLCIVTFIIVFFKGRYVVKWADMLALAVGLLAVIIWYQLQSATYANLILQVSIAIGFIPTFRNVWECPRNEPKMPWFIWCTAFTLGLLVVVARWEGQFQDLAYFVNCSLLHLSVGILSLRRVKASS